MSAVGAGVLSKLQRSLPNQIGDNKQWSSTYIAALTLAAAHAADERIGMSWVSDEISMTDDTLLYTYDTKLISVESVEFALDGSTYDKFLKPATFDDLDKISRKWRDDRGGYPERYVLTSTPGTQNPGGSLGAQIIVHRGLATAGSSTLRVSGWGIGTASTNVPDDVQERVHVPYAMAVLRAQHDVKEAMRFYRKFVKACDEVKGRFITPYPDQQRRLGPG